MYYGAIAAAGSDKLESMCASNVTRVLRVDAKSSMRSERTASSNVSFSSVG